MAFVQQRTTIIPEKYLQWPYAIVNVIPLKEIKTRIIPPSCISPRYLTNYTITDN